MEGSHSSLPPPVTYRPRCYYCKSGTFPAKSPDDLEVATFLKEISFGFPRRLDSKAAKVKKATAMNY